MVPYHTRARRHWPWVLVVAVIAVAAAVALVPDGGGNSSKTTPTSTPTSSTAGPTTTTLATYQVQRGDTLTSIAKHFGVSVASIVAQNHLTNPDQLTLGQTLQIPSVPPVQLT